jgi:DNA-directed RNA polymerase II subunit RPB2
MPPPDEEDVWRVLRDFLATHKMAKHQLDSFNQFTDRMLSHIITENSDVSYRSANRQYHIQFCNVTMLKPTVTEHDGWDRRTTPQTCRLRGLTYASNVICDVVHDAFDATTQQHLWRKVYRDITICTMPVMVGSNVCCLSDEPTNRADECELDHGGYFIINGNEKTVLSQEKLRTNHPFCWALGGHVVVCEVRSCHELKLRSTSTLKITATRPPNGGLPTLSVELPFLQSKLSLPMLFRVLGVGTREEAMAFVRCTDPGVEAILRCVFERDKHHHHLSADDAFEYLGTHCTREVTAERRAAYVRHIISGEFLPHMGLINDIDTKRRKLHFLGVCVRKLLHVYTSKLLPDDRDDYRNKRCDGAGALCALLFRQLFRGYLRSVHVTQQRLVDAGKIETANLGDAIASKDITSRLKYAFASGNWGVQKTGAGCPQTGVCQALSRTTVLSTLSNLRRVDTPVSRAGKAATPRQLHASSWGVLCCCETPEGHACGLIKNLALSASVRVGCFASGCISASILSSGLVLPLLGDAYASTSPASASDVFVNGVLIGATTDPAALVCLLRSWRRTHRLPSDASIASGDDGCLHVATDPGALCRPLAVASELKDRFTEIVRGTPAHENVFDALVRAGCIEWIDKAEEATLNVAVRMSSVSDDAATTDAAGAGAAAYTHSELDPCLILGIMASIIPFSNHNQSPRNTYQSAMGKQAVGVYATSWMQRMDGAAHVLMYPQKQLVTTRVEQALGTDELPSGQTLIVAILAYSGFNQEDSVIVNKGAIDRGALRSFAYKTFRDDESTAGADAQRLGDPTRGGGAAASGDGAAASGGVQCAGLRAQRYDTLARETGAARPGVVLTHGDAVIGMTMSTADLADEGEARANVLRDKSTIYRSREPAVVDCVVASHTANGNRSVRVRVRSVRIPEVGDKVSSRHGQKGVIGSLMQQADLPFDPLTGEVPDIIVNPHAIPSRMTVAQLLEALLGTLCCVEGRCGDGTAFRNVSMEGVADELEARGFDRYGKRSFVNGQTGELMKGDVFLAPTYYQRLKHMVIDKLHARARGPVSVVTRQPVEGRSRDGGLRFGEMERDTLIAHGATGLLLDRLYDASDAFAATICMRCGLLARAPNAHAIVQKREPRCAACGSDECVRKPMPYSTKLLLQELYVLGIAPRIRLNKT